MRIFLFIALLYAFSAGLVYANEKVLILGYQNNLTDNEVWQNNQVGFGVKNQLRQTLFDKQNIDILDEKTLSLKVPAGDNRLTLHDSSKPAWMLEKKDVSSAYLSTMAKKYQLDSIYWVRITRFAKPESELTIAIWSSKKVTKELTLKVCRFIQSSRSIQCQQGKGSSTKRSRAFFYKPIKDRHKQQKHFNDSAVGKISLKAIQQAVSKL